MKTPLSFLCSILFLIAPSVTATAPSPFGGPAVKYFDPKDFMTDQTTLPDLHVWAGDAFKIELKEIPRREVPYGVTTWFREVEWQKDSWTPLGKSGKLDVTTDCQDSVYPEMHISGCGANLLSFAQARLYSHSGRFLGRYMSTQSHLYFYVTVHVHQPQAVLVPTWYGTHFTPTWKDLDYPQILRFQCHSLGGHAQLPLYSQVKNPNEGEIRGYNSNQTSLLGSGFHYTGFSRRDPGSSHRFEARCCVRGSDVKLQDKCGAWVPIALRSNFISRRKWCPKFTGTYSLTKDSNNNPTPGTSKCRQPLLRLLGRMKNKVCEGQTAVYQPHYEAQAWFRQSLASPVLNNMLPFEGDAGSTVAPRRLTIQNMSHRYAGWYMYNTTAVASGEILADIGMEAKLRVFIELKRLDHKSITIKCLTNLDHDRHAGLKVWWDIKASVESVKKLDDRTLQIEDACFNTRGLLNYLFHLRCHASTYLQTGVSAYFSGNGWKTYYEASDAPHDHWTRWFFRA